MLQDLLEWLDEQVTERGLTTTILALAALVGTAGTLTAPFGAAVPRAAVASVVAMAVLTTSVSLFAARRGSQRDLSRVSKLLERYCRVIQDWSAVKLEYLRWHQKVTINPRGDAVVVRRVRVAPAGNDLHFLAFNLVYYGSTPLTPRLRGRVRATAREISVDDVEGARYPTTTTWLSENVHQILVHFPGAVPAGHQASVEVQWNWPLYSADLMQGGVEDFDVVFENLTERATYEVVLEKRSPDDHFVVSGIGATKYTFDPPGGSALVRFSAERPGPNDQIGVRIDKVR
jgi:hypothetical protein